MRARSKEQYKRAWEHHIQELATLALAAKIDYNEWVEIKQDLEEWLDKAIKQQLWDETNGK